MNDGPYLQGTETYEVWVNYNSTQAAIRALTETQSTVGSTQEGQAYDKGCIWLGQIMGKILKGKRRKRGNHQTF